MKAARGRIWEILYFVLPCFDAYSEMLFVGMKYCEITSLLSSESCVSCVPTQGVLLFLLVLL